MSAEQHYTPRRIWEILEPAATGDRLSRTFDIFICAVILIAILGNILSGESWIPDVYQPLFNVIEVAVTLIFLIEYTLRLVFCKAAPEYGGTWGRLRWAFSPLAILDFLALLSGLLWFVDVNLTFLRAIRLVRLFRLTRYSAGIQMIQSTFAACRHELTVVASGLVTVLVMAASVLHIAERDAQPETFGSFFTSLWWGICTLTTVGYGDVYPVTTLGRFSASVIAVIGIGAFALPSGIIAAHFNDVLSKSQASRVSAEHEKDSITCPHCGHKIDIPKKG